VIGADMDRVDYQSLVVQDLVNLKKAEELDISPWYQRRSVWNTNQRSYLINTLLEKKPIPALYIRHYIDIDKEKSIKEVVDGQQRIRAILGYVDNDFSAYHPTKNKKIFYKDLGRDLQQSFLMTSLPIGYLLGASDGDVIEIFGRINSVSKSLNAQEKRNAQFSGDFKQFSLRQAADRTEFWRFNQVFTSSEISRMEEVQFVSDLIMNMVLGLQDFGATRLNKFYAANDDEFPEVGDIEKRLDRVLNIFGEMDQGVIKDTLFRRQPIFFSLCLVLDKLPGKLDSKKIGQKMYAIDRRLGGYELSGGLDGDDASFIRASSATTQRIAQRQVRASYLSRQIS
jgi:hypothetical protein